MGDVVSIGGTTKLDINPDEVLENLKGELSSFILAGISKDGKEERFFSTTGSMSEALWLAARFQQVWLTMDDEED